MCDTLFYAVCDYIVNILSLLFTVPLGKDQLKFHLNEVLTKSTNGSGSIKKLCRLSVAHLVIIPKSNQRANRNGSAPR